MEIPIFIFAGAAGDAVLYHISLYSHVWGGDSVSGFQD